MRSNPKDIYAISQGDLADLKITAKWGPRR